MTDDRTHDAARERRRAAQIEAIVRDASSASGRRGRRRPSPPRHARREEREIKDNVLRMGSLVETRSARPAGALIDARRRRGAARSSGRRRHQRGAAPRSPRSSRATIATQQPVARDLRFLLSLDHVAYELERMGDHAASVAKQARKLAPHPPLERLRRSAARWASAAAELVRGVLRALVDIDAGHAREVAARDDEVDDLYHRIFDEVIDLMREDPANVDRGSADHASPRTTWSASETGSRTSPRTSSSWRRATIEDLNP